MFTELLLSTNEFISSVFSSFLVPLSNYSSILLFRKRLRIISIHWLVLFLFLQKTPRGHPWNTGDAVLSHGGLGTGLWRSTDPLPLLSRFHGVISVKHSRRARPWEPRPQGAPKKSNCCLHSVLDSGSCYVNDPFQDDKRHPNAQQEVLQHIECLGFVCLFVLQTHYRAKTVFHVRKRSSERREIS